MFFFEKKNQKTFAGWHTRPRPKWTARATQQKFFASFFQKRSLPSLLYPSLAENGWVS
jgi:hypothetical protein